MTFEGPPSALAKAKGSLTADYVSGRKRIEMPATRRKATGKIVVRGASENNLKNIDVEIPLGCLVAITGPSGAGKSSLVNGILLPALAKELHDSTDRIGAARKNRRQRAASTRSSPSINARSVAPTAQQPRHVHEGLRRNPRALFALGAPGLPRARLGRLSVQLQFEGRPLRSVRGRRRRPGVENALSLSDVYVVCEVCQGKRYDSETLAVKYKGNRASRTSSTRTWPRAWTYFRRTLPSPAFSERCRTSASAI